MEFVRPAVLAYEIALLKWELGHDPIVSVCFDGTTRIGEVLAVVICFILGGKGE